MNAPEPTTARPSGKTRRLTRMLALSVATSALAGVAFTGATTASAQTAVNSAIAGAIPTSDTFVPVAGPVFGDPTAASNQILTRLLDNIAHTPKGATIRIVGYSFSLGKVATALLRAHDRGVNVQIVMDGHSKQWSPAQRLVPELGTDASQPSFMVLTRGSARGGGGVNHQKSWSFSQVGRTQHVVMVGSTNLTGYGTGTQYSDNYVYTSRPDVWAAYSELFQQQKHDRPVTSPFTTKTWSDGNAYFFPNVTATATTDPVVKRIEALPSDVNTNIRVAQFAWHGERGLWIAKALAGKRRAGATVSAVVGESVGAGVKGILRDAGIPMSDGVYANGKRIHNKLMMASWVNATGPHQAIWTGSDNWTEQSLRNEETMLEVDDDVAGYNKYVGFFNRLVSLATPAPAPVPTTPTTPPVPTTPASPTTPTTPTTPNPPRVPVTPQVPTTVPAVKKVTKLTSALSAARVHRYRRAVVSGTVGPVYARRVVLVQRRWVGSTAWRTVAKSAPLTSTRYAVRVPTRKLGDWRYRTQVVATSKATAAISRVVALRVVR